MHRYARNLSCNLLALVLFMGGFGLLALGLRTQEKEERDLPIYLSPARARTESERQAVELLFESLIELGTEADGGRYRPVLALGRPQMIPLGRLFRLPRDRYEMIGFFALRT